MVVQCQRMIISSRMFCREIHIYKITSLEGEGETIVEFNHWMRVSEFTVEINIWEHELEKRKHSKGILVEHEE